MASMETQKMMDLVTEKTGYGVSVIMASDIASWADMVSASEKNPRHLIRVNAKYARYGDYLVALQCAMLMIKWADPFHLPCFLVRQSKTEKIINEVSKDHKLRNLPSAVRHQFSKMIVEGLLNQLQSAPTEMMAIEICYELCPGLRGVQEEAVEVNLPEMTASLSTQIRDRTPSEVFRKTAAMNAAFCLEWAERSGDRPA